MKWTKIGCCRICGCTDDNACFSGCCWVEDNLCSTCAPYLNIPQELRELNRWVAWDGTKKHPVNPHGDGYVNRIKYGSLGSFTEVLSFANSKGLSNIALLLPKDIYTVDMDYCIVNGEVNKLALEIINKMKSYTEISPSGNGIHIICRGHLSQYPSHIGFSSLFGEDRFIAFTGHQIFEDYSISDDMERKLWWLRGTSPRWR